MHSVRGKWGCPGRHPRPYGVRCGTSPGRNHSTSHPCSCMPNGSGAQVNLASRRWASYACSVRLNGRSGRRSHYRCPATARFTMFMLPVDQWRLNVSPEIFQPSAVRWSW